ncbi:ABC transporter permease [Mucilaginibacter gynuensis]|uniref:ABC transporter permease n=1 Tax=Mucilaginibacter gynuensis TaxID=1302236 RepID=A0ABP8GZY5_9SPHI
MFRNYIKTAFRSLRKNKGFTFINIMGLTLGIASCLLIIFYVVDELSYDKYNTHADRIYRVNADIKFGGSASSNAITPPPLSAALMSNFPEVEKAVRMYHDVGVRVKKSGESIQEDKVVYGDAGLFDVFTLPFVEGNPNTALAEPHTVVITEAMAKKYFNDTHVIGQTLTVNDTAVYKITGVMQDIPAQSHFNFDFFFSMASRPEYRSTDWFTYSCGTYILLKNGADAAKLQAKFPALIRKATENQSAEMDMAAFEKMGNYFRLNLTPLTEIHLQSNRMYELGVNGNMQYIYIFSAIALFILLIACVNFMNLSTARSANRAREVGVRKVLGSPRKYLVAQFLSESLIVTLFATLIAILAAWILLPYFNDISGKTLSINARTLAWLIPSAFVGVLVIGVLAGAYPAFFLSGFQPINVLKGKLSTGFKGGGLRSFLVVFQFSISIFLIIGTLIIYNQLQYIQNKNLGFNRNQVLTIKNTHVLGSQAKILKQEIKQLPGILNATLSGYSPTNGVRNPDGVFSQPDPAPKNALFTEIWPVDEDYLPTMGMSMASGRNFSKDLASDSAGIIINEAAAKMLSYLNDPLNKKLYRPINEHIKEYHVIGVVKDFNFASLRNNVSPVVMVFTEDNGALSIRANAANITGLLSTLRAKWKTLSPDQHFDYSFMDEDFDALYRSEQRMGKLFIVFTSLAIIIACLGLFGLAAYAAEQRNKEISIRKVLGASMGGIVAMLSKDFIKLVLIALVIAAPLAWLCMQQWLQGFAYRTNIQWWVFALSGAGAIAIAFVTISSQSLKAALVNPIKGLRSE